MRARSAVYPQKYSCVAEIVLVDDDLTFTETLGALLGRAGFTVVTAPSYAEARAYLSEHTPNALITDVRLESWESGWQLVQFARDQQPSLPIVVVTGFANDHTYHEALRFRTPLFLKPFDADELVTFMKDYAK
jgi:DNA-binding NtrC family response regulator